MALTCKNDGKPAVRAISDLETGDQSFLCWECFGGAQSVEPAPTYPHLCEMCNTNETEFVNKRVADGFKTALCGSCAVIDGRVRWELADPSQLEELDLRAQAIVDAMGVERKPKTKRPRKVAVRDEGDSEPTLEPATEESPEQVEENATPKEGEANAGAQ